MTNSSESAPDMLGMVEKVARALYECGFPERKWPDVEAHNRPFWTQHAIATLKALRVPTPEMVEAGQQCEAWGGDGGQIYRAMIDSALAGKE